MAIQRGFATTTAAVLLCLSVADTSSAQNYPNQPIKIIVPSGAGSPTDISARLTSQLLAPRLGQPVVIDNRPGAGGAIGTRVVARAASDGYTLLSAGSAMLAVIPSISSSAGYDPIKDFAPIAQVMAGYHVLVVHPSSPWMTVQDLVGEARKNPSKLNYAHVGTGHLTHLAAEMFLSSAGISMVGVPYRGGGETQAAMLSKTVDTMFGEVAILLPLIRQGRLRALAMTGRRRTALAPDIPTMIESGIPGYDVTTFFGLVAPAGTPAGIISKLNAAMNEGLRAPETKAMIANLGAETTVGSPEDFRSLIADQYQRWATVGKAAGVRLD